jgi:hypothetical protein
MANSSVFISAMALAKMPSLLSSMRQMDVPYDATEALRVFSGEEDAIRRAVIFAGIPRDHLVSCVENYVRNVFLYENASASRIFALRDKKDRSQLRLHRKLLLERLHPDKSKSQDDVTYTRRVLEAWKAITRDDIEIVHTSTKRMPFSGPRLRWIRVPVEKLSIFSFQRKRSRDV